TIELGRDRRARRCDAPQRPTRADEHERDQRDAEQLASHRARLPQRAMMREAMAQIRIVDDWLRSPASPPSHYRSVMVIAEKWAEQRVLMRAYAESRDQTRPTILLHGIELAIGPAGLDLNGPWGIHVG